MTKTKTKKEKIVDLKPKAEKITDDQLKRLQTTVSEINQTQLEVGRIEVQKHNIMHNLVQNQKTLMELQDEFKKDYDTFDININDGAINYKDEQTDKKD